MKNIDYNTVEVDIEGDGKAEKIVKREVDDSGSKKIAVYCVKENKELLITKVDYLDNLNIYGGQLNNTIVARFRQDSNYIFRGHSYWFCYLFSRNWNSKNLVLIDFIWKQE